MEGRFPLNIFQEKIMNENINHQMVLRENIHASESERFTNYNPEHTTSSLSISLTI